MTYFLTWREKSLNNFRSSQALVLDTLVHSSQALVLDTLVRSSQALVLDTLVRSSQALVLDTLVRSSQALELTCFTTSLRVIFDEGENCIEKSTKDKIVHCFRVASAKQSREVLG